MVLVLGNLIGLDVGHAFVATARSADLDILQENVLDGMTGIAGDDAVHQGTAKYVLCFHPLCKGGGETPDVGIAGYIILQHGAVVIDEFAGEN